jgi:hypothetical protein
MHGVIYLEKAHDRVPREVLNKVINKKGGPKNICKFDSGCV